MLDVEEEHLVMFTFFLLLMIIVSVDFVEFIVILHLLNSKKFRYLKFINEESPSFSWRHAEAWFDVERKRIALSVWFTFHWRV